MATSLNCSSCARNLGNVYHSRNVSENFHLRCYLKNLRLVSRSLVASLIVGTILTLINQGDLVVSGNYQIAMLWKIPLTYTIPFLVATWGAVTNSRVSRVNQ